MTAIKIVQLYPDELGVAGDRGNVMALAERLRRAGIESESVEYRRGDSFPVDADAVVVGSGPLSAMRNVLQDFSSLAETLKDLTSDSVPIFAFGSGAELLGHEIELVDKTRITGMGILPLRTVRTTKRQVGYIITQIESGKLVGFEDHASRWELDAGASAFGTVLVGGGNGDGVGEGVMVGSVTGTQVGGPVLPLNPALTDSILRRILKRKGIEYEVGESHEALDAFAQKARSVIERNSSYKFSTI